MTTSISALRSILVPLQHQLGYLTWTLYIVLLSRWSSIRQAPAPHNPTSISLIHSILILRTL